MDYLGRNFYDNWLVKKTVFWVSAAISLIFVLIVAASLAVSIIKHLSLDSPVNTIVLLSSLFLLCFFLFWRIIFVVWFSDIKKKKDQAGLFFGERPREQFVFYRDQGVGKITEKEFIFPPEIITFGDLKKKLEIFPTSNDIIASSLLFNLLQLDVYVSYVAEKILDILDKYHSFVEFEEALKSEAEAALKKAGEAVFYSDDGNVYPKKGASILVWLNLRNQFLEYFKPPENVSITKRLLSFSIGNKKLE
jgi:hypothetical protein